MTCMHENYYALKKSYNGFFLQMKFFCVNKYFFIYVQS